MGGGGGGGGGVLRKRRGRGGWVNNRLCPIFNHSIFSSASSVCKTRLTPNSNAGRKY